MTSNIVGHSGDNAESCVMSSRAAPISRWVHAEAQDLCSPVTSSAVVGSSAIMISGEHAIAAAIVTAGACRR
jgi:hypothetical protein